MDKKVKDNDDKVYYVPIKEIAIILAVNFIAGFIAMLSIYGVQRLLDIFY